MKYKLVGTLTLLGAIYLLNEAFANYFVFFPRYLYNFYVYPKYFGASGSFADSRIPVTQFLILVTGMLSIANFILPIKILWSKTGDKFQYSVVAILTFIFLFFSMGAVILLMRLQPAH